jgi:radical SAM protein with 4Fe4S-binding SPASM domain
MQDEHDKEIIGSKYLLFEVIGECNLKCNYCYNVKYSERKKRLLEKELILDTIEEAKKLGFNIASFSGGEPLLRPDIISILEDSTLPTSILTNGLLLTDNTIKRLTTIETFLEARISLDGFVGHDKVRGKGTSKKIIENLRIMKEYQLPFSINTMVTSETLHELLDLYSLIEKEFEEITWRIDLPFLYGRYSETYQDLKVDLPALFQIYRILLKQYLSVDPHFEMEIVNVFKTEMLEYGLYEYILDEHPCAYAIDSYTIRPDGCVSFCPSLHTYLGNITNKCLNDIIHSEENLKFNAIKIRDIPACWGCKYLYICGTGCRADALYNEGNIMAKDTIACESMKLTEQYILPLLPEEIQNNFLELKVEEC